MYLLISMLLSHELNTNLIFFLSLRHSVINPSIMMIRLMGCWTYLPSMLDRIFILFVIRTLCCFVRGCWSLISLRCRRGIDLSIRCRMECACRQRVLLGSFNSNRTFHYISLHLLILFSSCSPRPDLPSQLYNQFPF